MIILGNATVPANSTVPVFTMPILSNFTVFQPAGLQSVYIGSSTRVTSVNGMPVPTSPLVVENYNSSSGVTYYATTGNGTASSFQYIISTAA